MHLDFSVITSSLPYLWKGFQYTVQLTTIAALGGLFFGTLLALARLSPIKALAMIASGYVNLMRSIPLVLVIFWFFFLMPEVLQAKVGDQVELWPEDCSNGKISSAGRIGPCRSTS